MPVSFKQLVKLVFTEKGSEVPSKSFCHGAEKKATLIERIRVLEKGGRYIPSMNLALSCYRCACARAMLVRGHEGLWASQRPSLVVPEFQHRPSLHPVLVGTGPAYCAELLLVEPR